MTLPSTLGSGQGLQMSHGQDAKCQEESMSTEDHAAMATGMDSLNKSWRRRIYLKNAF